MCSSSCTERQGGGHAWAILIMFIARQTRKTGKYHEMSNPRILTMSNYSTQEPRITWIYSMLLRTNGAVHCCTSLGAAKCFKIHGKTWAPMSLEIPTLSAAPVWEHVNSIWTLTNFHALFSITEMATSHVSSQSRITLITCQEGRIFHSPPRRLRCLFGQCFRRFRICPSSCRTGSSPQFSPKLFFLQSLSFSVNLLSLLQIFVVAFFLFAFFHQCIFRNFPGVSQSCVVLFLSCFHFSIHLFQNHFVRLGTPER